MFSVIGTTADELANVAVTKHLFNKVSNEVFVAGHSTFG